MGDEALISTQQLLDFLGAGAESTELVDGLRASALDGLRRATGVDWSQKDSNLGTVNEYLRTEVWLSFYVLRGADVRTDFLRGRLIELAVQLQYGKEATSDAAQG